MPSKSMGRTVAVFTGMAMTFSRNCVMVASAVHVPPAFKPPTIGGTEQRPVSKGRCEEQMRLVTEGRIKRNLIHTTTSNEVKNNLSNSLSKRSFKW